MKTSDFLNLVAAGANVSVDANEFTLQEARLLARTAAKSGALVTITHADVFAPSELYMIASEGKTHVSFPDIAHG